MKIHVASVHEGKKQFKCDICDYSCSRKGDMKTHVASVHEGKNRFSRGVSNIVSFKRA